MKLYRNIMLFFLPFPLVLFFVQTHDTEGQGLAAAKEGLMWFWLLGLAALVFHLAHKFEELTIRIGGHRRRK